MSEVPGWAAAILEPEHYATFIALFEAELRTRGVTWTVEDSTALVGTPPRKVRLAALARSLAESPREAWADEIVAQMDLVLGTSRTRGLESTPFDEIAPQLLLRIATTPPEGALVVQKLADEFFAVLLVAHQPEPIEVPRSATKSWGQDDATLFGKAKENVLRTVRVRTASAGADPDPRTRKKDDAWIVLQGSTRLTTSHALLLQHHLASPELAGARASLPPPKNGSIVSIPNRGIVFARPIDRLDDLRILPWMLDATRSEHDVATPIDRVSMNLWWSSADGAFLRLPTRAMDDGATQVVLPKSFIDAVVTPLSASDPPADATQRSLQPPAHGPTRVVLCGADGKPLA